MPRFTNNGTVIRYIITRKIFNIWLDNNIIVKLLFIDSHTKYIKRVLVIITADLKERSLY